MLKAKVNRDTGKWILRFNICGQELESEEHESASAAARDLGYNLAVWLWNIPKNFTFLYTSYKNMELDEEGTLDRLKYGCRKLQERGYQITFHFANGAGDIVYNDEDSVKEVVQLFNAGRTLSHVNFTKQSDTESVSIDMWPRSVRFNEIAPVVIISLWDAGGEILHVSGREFERLNELIISWTRDRVTDWLASIVLASKKEDCNDTGRKEEA